MDRQYQRQEKYKKKISSCIQSSWQQQMGVCHGGHQCLEEPDKTHEEEEKEPVN